MIELHESSEAYKVLKLAFESGRMVRIEQRADGIAVKTGEGMWTYTMRTTPPEPTTELTRVEGERRRPSGDTRATWVGDGDCGHLLCVKCSGHIFWLDDEEHPTSHGVHTCHCCHVCGRRGGH